MKLDDALALARSELGNPTRHLRIRHCSAWALYKAGKPEEAVAPMTEALRLGTKDAKLFFHAGMIYRSLGQADRAREFLARALSTNPRFHLLHAPMAERILKELETPVSERRLTFRRSGSRACSLRLSCSLRALGLAHPMGNFSISHYAGITLAATEIELRYLIDMAEIPTFQELQDSGLTPEAAPSIREWLPRAEGGVPQGQSLPRSERRTARPRDLGARPPLLTRRGRPSDDEARDPLSSESDHGDGSCVASCPLSGRKLPGARRLEGSRGGARPRRRAGE